MRHKLYLQIYIAFFIGLILFAIISAAIAWKQFSSFESGVPFITGMKELVTQAVQPGAPTHRTERTLRRLAKGFSVELSLYDQQAQHIASSHRTIALPKDSAQHGWKHEHRRGLFVLNLSDGRQLVIHHRRPPMGGKWYMFIVLMLVFAAVAYPLAKRLTSRLETLQKQVDAFGAGNLTARAEIKGKDEIAALAQRFNHTAERIEQLIKAQKHILAGASHELRTPLTRMRLAIELMQEESLETTQMKLTSYITELDDLVGELLLASKLDADTDQAMDTQSIDLLALAAEEASHYESEVTGDSVNIQGNERLLRRLLRNLLQNADRYRIHQPINILVQATESQAILTICDDGSGISEIDANRIFEPFYQARSSGNKTGNIGLGLSLVKKIAEKHHGRVRYLNQENHGACFEVRIPRI